MLSKVKKMLNPSYPVAGWLAHFKSQYHMKNVKLAGEADSVDEEAAEEFLKYLLSIIY